MRNNPLKFKIAYHVKGFHKMHLKLNEGKPTYETLRFWPIMTKILPQHWNKTISEGQFFLIMLSLSLSPNFALAFAKKVKSNYWLVNLNIPLELRCLKGIHTMVR